ncbi:MAG: hypothetical protein CR986_08830 [Ignavibacteriae bacterium]|nr:MAG: hypothetical protein CR986_08830 [Ignavibacteriota bacterium]
MKQIYKITTILLLVFGIWACNDYVTNVEKPTDLVDENELTADDIIFLERTVEFRYAQTVSRLLMCAEGLSDAFIFDRDVRNATFPTYAEIDQGQILLNNNSVNGFYNYLGELRKYADDLLTKANQFSLDSTSKARALYIANFYGGMARYLYATYFGLNPTEGGATINLGPFIPSSEMYNLALTKFKEALNYADSYQKRVTNTFIARIYLFTGDYANATQYALQGMQEGDDPFQALFHKEASNQYYIFAGRYRAQFVVDNRFKDYIDADSTEMRPVGVNTTAGRISIELAPTRSGNPRYRQALILDEDDPLTTCTWQENNLMLAELALRGQAAAGDPLTLVNQVRASHKITLLTSIDLDGIYVERDKELFIQGLRLPDQRRFGKFHLPAGSWQYFPITDDERNANPNID